MSLLDELRRRNVLRIGAAYVVTAWLVIQVVETVFPFYGIPDSVIRLVITALGIGLVPVLVFAWLYELTPGGLRRESEVDRSALPTTRPGKTLDRVIMVSLTLALCYFAFDKFVLSETREAEIAEAARQEARTEAVVHAYGNRSIAVLPFADMSPEKDQEYMSDGIAEELLNLLARVPELRVISRSSAFAFKGRGIDIPAIAAQLNVAYILEGSVRTAGSQVRITAQLIEASSDTHRWSETYDRELKNVFDIQDEIAERVVREITSTLLGNVPKSQRINEEAYTLVLQARYFWNRRAEGDEEMALELYKRAVEIDPYYAAAWTGLSVAYAVAAMTEEIDSAEGFEKAREAVGKALELEPNSAEAHVRLSQALMRDGDMAGSLAELKTALELDPNNPLVLGVLALQAGREGRIDDGVRFLEKAESIDPLGAIWPLNKGVLLIRFHRLDEAKAALDRYYELSGNLQDFQENMIDIHNLRGEYDKALKILEPRPREGFNRARMAIALYGMGHIEASAAILESIKADDEPSAALGVAQIFAARGENDLAFERLANIENISPWRVVYDPYIQLLGEDPRWKSYVDSLDWPWDYQY